MNSNTPRQPNNRNQNPQGGQNPQNGNRNQNPQGGQNPQNGSRSQNPQYRPPQANQPRPQQYANCPQQGQPQRPPQMQRPPQYANRPVQGQRPQQNPYGQPYPQVKHRSRRQARRAAGLVLLTVVILAMLLVSVIIFAARCASGRVGGDDTDDAAQTTPSAGTLDAVTTPEVTTEPPPETTSLADTYQYQTKTAEDVHRGYQILVNYQNEYLFDNVFTMQTFYGHRNKSYKIRDIIISADVRMMENLNEMMAAMEAEAGINDALVNSALRDYAEQEKLYAARVDMYGDEYAQLFVAMPGHSEHHTGLAVDFTVYTDDNQAKTFDKAPEYPEWLRANAHRFGFIERYADDKTDFTKITYENWHYRYIGKPHAYYMVENNLCLEEYIDLLRKYEFGEKTLQITDDEGTMWEIYFVPASADGTTAVPVPKYMEYELSGNNVDGFIVTCKAS